MNFIMSILDWLEQFLPVWYLLIGLIYGGYHFVRTAWHDIELIGRLVWKVLWNTILIPVLLGLLWPISVFLHLARNVWGLHNIWIFKQLYGSSWNEK